MDENKQKFQLFLKNQWTRSCFFEKESCVDCNDAALKINEAYREIQTIKAETPVIFMTGYGLDGVQTNFILEEGFDVIQKPFMLISLGKKVREVLARG